MNACSGDELFLEPWQGELKPNSHCNIKMTLQPGKYPCNFEGEIQCSIDWENENRIADEARSVATNTNVPEVSEFLFIRLKKRANIVSTPVPAASASTSATCEGTRAPKSQPLLCFHPHMMS